MDIRSTEDFKKIVRTNVLQPLLQKLAKKVGMKLQHYINENWYVNSESEYYDRTYDFLTSVTDIQIKMSGKDCAYEVFIDYNKMSQHPSGVGMFGARTSLNNDTEYGGKSISEWLIQWIEKGQKSSVNSYEGIHMFENVSEQLKTEINSLIYSSFAEMGISIKN